MASMAQEDHGRDRPNLSTVIAPYLPFLRRYARSLAGAQAAGDAYVAQTLEALIADRDAMDQSLPPRVALYRLFQAIWTSAAVRPAQPTDAAPDPLAEDGPDMGAAPISSRARQLLLLTSVEEFSVDEAATVMDIDRDEAELLAADAKTELAAQTGARVMIIEDEPIIALDIESIVEAMGHNVVGTADTHAGAVAKAAEVEPDLILADIQLADGSSGVEAVDEILASSTVPVVFVTAYPERLLTGERVEPSFLVTKPFRPEAIEAAIAQALFHNPKS